MKRICRLALGLLVLCSVTDAQQTAFLQSQTFTGNVAPGPQAVMQQNSNVTIHVLSWIVTGTVSTCAVQVETSSSPVSGFIVVGTAQTCTTSGTYSVSGGANTWARFNVTSLSATGTVAITYQGFSGNYGIPQFDITAFGGLCNDTTLDQAIAAVPQTATSNGGIINIPGTCTFSTTHFTSKNNITFRGIGGWRYIARSTPASFLNYTGTDNFFVITGQGVRFQDINIKAPNVRAAIVPPVIAGGNFTLTSPGSGTLASTENFQVIYLNNNYGGSDLGSTAVSNEITVTSIGTNCVTVASPAVTGDADNYEVFMGSISGNEVRVTGAIAIGTPVQVCAAVNLGTRPLADTSAKAAIYTTSAPVLDNAEIFSGVVGAFGVGGDGFIQSVGSGPLVRHSKIEGFSVGIEMGTGSNAFKCCEQTLFENNGWDLVIGNGGGITIDNGIWQQTATGHIKLLNVSTAHVTNNYFEQNTTPQPFVQLGDTTVPTISNKTVGPVAFDFSNNYGNCTSLHWASGGSPIEIIQFNGFIPGSVKIANNTFSGCENQLIIDNAAQIATANINIDGNVQYLTAFHPTNCNGGQCGWLTNAGSATGRLTGVGPDNNDPINNTSLTPTIPSFPQGIQTGSVGDPGIPLALYNSGNPGYTLGFQIPLNGRASVLTDSAGSNLTFDGVNGIVLNNNAAGCSAGVGAVSAFVACNTLNNSFSANLDGSNSVNGGTYTTDLNPLNLTWVNNAAGVTFNGAKWTLIDSASGVNSSVFQIFGGAVGTTNLFKLSKGGNLALAGGITATTLNTATNCAGVGTAANPSVATCAAAAAGHFSCATNATGGTCQVNTTAVTANSEIFVFESDTAITGTALGVTCNTGTNVLPASRLLASSVAGAGFTINLGTVTTNPACFSYRIEN